ncbi:putative proteasome endopeptidase complex [Tanacetum coccineum]
MVSQVEDPISVLKNVDCSRPCEKICPANAISFKSALEALSFFMLNIVLIIIYIFNAKSDMKLGVITERCYGCGRCFPAVANSTSATFLRVAGSELSQKYDAHSGGEREIQRTMLELLNQLDGFDRRGDVKVILATNKIECLDPALIRPGRVDRKIEFPLPVIKTMRHIFQVQFQHIDTGGLWVKTGSEKNMLLLVGLG